MIHLNTHLSKRNKDEMIQDVNEDVNRWFIWTHTYQREMKM